MSHPAPPHPAPSSHTVHADFDLWEAKALVVAALLHANCSFVSGEPVSLQGWRRRSENKKKKKSGRGRKRVKEMSQMPGGGSKGLNNKEKEPHQRRESNQKNVERDSQRGENK